MNYKYNPVRFFLAAILSTWLVWGIASYFSYQTGSRAEQIVTVCELLGLFGPLVASLWLIFSSKSGELVKDYLGKLIDLRRINIWTLLPALFLFPLVMAVSVLISWRFFGRPPDQLSFVHAANFTAGLLPVPVMLFGAALVEEMGWKGYGVDSLRGKRTFFAATLIYAVLWALWHLPLFGINNYYHNLILRANPLFALNFILSVFPAAFVSNWLWYRNKGNILVPVLFHASCNAQGLFHLWQFTECVETIVLVMVVVMIVVMDRKLFFADFPPRIGSYGEE